MHKISKITRHFSENIICIFNLIQTAAFVDATDSRYGFRSKDLRRLGGSEKSRLTELMTTDHGEAILYIYYIY